MMKNKIVCFFYGLFFCFQLLGSEDVQKLCKYNEDTQQLIQYAFNNKYFDFDALFMKQSNDDKTQRMHEITGKWHLPNDRDKKSIFDVYSGHGQSPEMFFTFIRSSNIPMVKCMLDKNKKLLNKWLIEYKENGETALHHAIKMKTFSVLPVIMEAYVNNKIDVNTVDSYGWTVLYYAMCFYNQNKQVNEVVSQLIDNGAKINVSNEKSHRPLYIALANGYWEVVGHMLQKNVAHIGYGDITTTLNYAIEIHQAKDEQKDNEVKSMVANIIELCEKEKVVWHWRFFKRFATVVAVLTLLGVIGYFNHLGTA